MVTAAVENPSLAVTWDHRVVLEKVSHADVVRMIAGQDITVSPASRRCVLCECGRTLSAITADMVGDVVAQSLGRPVPVASGQTAVA